MRFKLTIDYIPGGDDQQHNVAEYIRSQLKKVGINVEVRASPDFPAWAKRIGHHDFDLTMDIVFNWGDPVIGVHRTYLSTTSAGVIWSNTQSYCNPKVDELLTRRRSRLDPAKRKALYAEFQKIVGDELPIYWINAVPYHTACDKRCGTARRPSGDRCRRWTRSTGRRSETGLRVPAPRAGPDDIAVEPPAEWDRPRYIAGARLRPRPAVAVVVLNFLLIHAAPGDPVEMIAGEMGGASPEMMAQIRASYGLDQPLLAQLGVYLGKVAPATSANRTSSTSRSPR